MQRVDLSILANNGMRRGRTTGTCAAAAVKAAVTTLLDKPVDEVDVTLPEGASYITVPIAQIERQSDGSVRVEVIKDAGDDPDVTDGATIFCLASINQGDTTRLLAASGVGTATEPGLRVGIGEPAINPAPRSMILHAIQETKDKYNKPDLNFDIAIGCVNGEQIAQKTFNPRLGVMGGISILGTTGIVEPMSLAAWRASVEVYVRVGVAGAKEIALLPGNIGIKFATSRGLAKKQIINISNFLGFALEAVETAVTESGGGLDRVFVLGHPGKLAKPLAGYWDTHSQESPMAMAPLGDFASKCGFPRASEIALCNTVEAAIELIDEGENAVAFWIALEDHLSELFKQKMPAVPETLVRLFSMSGRSLSERAVVK